jgi:hypothetical protein
LKKLPAKVTAKALMADYSVIELSKGLSINQLQKKIQFERGKIK